MNCSKKFESFADADKLEDLIKKDENKRQHYSTGSMSSLSAMKPAAKKHVLKVFSITENPDVEFPLQS